MTRSDEFSAIFSANSFYIARRMRDLFGAYVSGIINDDEYKIGAHMMLYSVMLFLPNFEFIKFKVVRGTHTQFATSNDYSSYWIEVVNHANERVAIIDLYNPEFMQSLKGIYRNDSNCSNYTQLSSEIGKCMTEHALVINTWTYLVDKELLASMH